MKLSINSIIREERIEKRKQKKIKIKLTIIVIGAD